MRNPIILTGVARSGTSMSAGIIDICGAKGGKLSGATGNNQKGMFENANIRNDLVKPLLTSLGVDPMAQNPLPNVNLFKDMDGDEWRVKVEQVLKEEGVGDDDVWFYKGAKACLMWPLWNKAFPNAKWVLVRRRSREIVNSCIRTSFMRAFQEEDGWYGWVDEHIKRFNEMLHANLNLREIWPQEMIDGRFSEAEDLIKWLELDWKEEEVKEFVTPTLWNQGRTVVNDKLINAFEAGRIG